MPRVYATVAGSRSTFLAAPELPGPCRGCCLHLGFVPQDTKVRMPAPSGELVPFCHASSRGQSGHTVQYLGKTQSPNDTMEPAPPEPVTRKENRNMTLRSPHRGSPRRAKPSMPFEERTAFPRALGCPVSSWQESLLWSLGGNAQDSAWHGWQTTRREA